MIIITTIQDASRERVNYLRRYILSLNITQHYSIWLISALFVGSRIILITLYRFGRGGRAAGRKVSVFVLKLLCKYRH